MKIETLHEFQELAHGLNYSAAAKNLNISQPNLSKHMSELEKELGFALFTKTRKIRLTPAGRVYLDAVCKMLLSHEVAIKNARTIENAHTQEIRVLRPFIFNEGTKILSKALRAYGKSDIGKYTVFIHGQDKSILDNVSGGAC